MELTFLGQQSWAVQAGTGFVLIDPVLPEWFGTSEHQRFRIAPSRSIDSKRMPGLRGVVVTNEHLDHFNLRSLLQLPKGLPVYFGELMPESCIAATRKAGLVPCLVKDREAIDLGDLCIRLFLCSPDSAAWEKRVYHVVVEGRGNRTCILIQSDGLIAPDLVTDLADGQVPPVGFFVATNNAQIPPPGAPGTYHNLLPLEPELHEGPFGIRVLHEVLCRVPEELGHMPHLALCGGGYAQDPPKHGRFLMGDAAQLNNQLGMLAMGQTVHFPVPGDCFRIEDQAGRVTVERGKAGWIHLIPDPPEVPGTTPGPQNGQWFDHAIFPDFPSEGALRKAMEEVKSELARMAPVLLFSDLGRDVTACNTYLNGPTGPHRFAFRLYASGRGHCLTAALDINRSRFDWLEMNEDEVIQQIPFGVDVHLVDLQAVLQGAIQIWELATARMRQWFMGRDRMKCPISFLYGYFSEQVRPDLAEKMYDLILRAPAIPG